MPGHAETMKNHTHSESQTKPLHKGRAVQSNRSGRFESWSREYCVADGSDNAAEPRPKVTVKVDAAKSAIARNHSPDLPFEQSVNMYRGCEHGCPYCYARPSHAYLGYSAGLDFETRLLAKTEVAQRLREEISKLSYVCKPITLGSNTDPYQPIERQYKLTRQVLEVLLEHRHPLQITTKSASILRDLDLLSELAALNLLEVNITLATLGGDLSRAMEPYASSPKKRLKAIAELAQAGIPVTIFIAPVIPGLNDYEIESVLQQCAAAGAVRARWTMIRLPQEVKQLFDEWVNDRFPNQASKIFSLIRQVRAGTDNDSEFFSRMRGSGPIADMIDRRFEMALRKFGLDNSSLLLDRSKFRHQPAAPMQADIFSQAALGSAIKFAE